MNVLLALLFASQLAVSHVLPSELHPANSPPTSDTRRTDVRVQKRQLSALITCNSIMQDLGSDAVNFVISSEYFPETQHYSSAAQELPACVVQPSTSDEVASILRVIDDRQTNFAVQSGGHNTNKGFSSTNGVHISLSRFNHVNLSADGLTADVGPGQTWGDVYKALEPLGRTVVGGRVNEVGVGGLLSGGGFSFFSNQYGLGVDNIVEYTLVLPTGNVTQVTTTSNNQLFNALKGTGNNFGIITSFKLKTVPLLPEIYGGLIIFTEDQFPAVNGWVTEFASNSTSDPKAAILPVYSAILSDLVALLILQIFYDGPTPPAGMFDGLLAIPSLSKNVGTRSFTDFLDAVPSDSFAGLRNTFHTVPIRSYSAGFIDRYAQLVSEWSRRGALHSGVAIQGTPEHFTSSAFQQASGLEAFAHQGPLNACMPTCLGLTWLSPLDDEFWIETAKEIAANLTAFAEEEGQDLTGCPLYPNYALGDTPVDQIYIGDGKLEGLRALRSQIDPRNVMGLTGGFKLG